MFAFADGAFAVANSTTMEYTVFLPHESIAVGTYICLIVAISVVANTLVVTTMASRRNALKFKSTHVFIVALAISDIFFSLSIHPILALTSFGIPSEMIFSQTVCNWYGFGAMFFGCLSMLIHGTVSYSRFKSIVYPHEARWRSFRFSYILLAVDVVISLSFALAPILGWGRYETFEFGCTVAFHDRTLSVRTYVIVMLIFVLGVPLSTCIVCYSRITFFSYQCKLQLFNLRSQTHANIVEDLQEEEKPNIEKKSSPRCRQIRVVDDHGLISLVDKKLTRLTFITATGFIFAWTPFAILSIWETFYPPTDIPSAYRIVASLFCKSATAYNPFIYFFMSTGFRQDVLQMCNPLACCKSSATITEDDEDDFDDHGLAKAGRRPGRKTIQLGGRREEEGSSGCSRRSNCESSIRSSILLQSHHLDLPHHLVQTVSDTCLPRDVVQESVPFHASRSSGDVPQGMLRGQGGEDYSRMLPFFRQ